MAASNEVVKGVKPEPGGGANVITQSVDCANCHNQVILFSRTIQTFCYYCGLPVTRLDPDGLYYDVIDQPVK